MSFYKHKIVPNMLFVCHSSKYLFQAIWYVLDITIDAVKVRLFSLFSVAHSLTPNLQILYDIDNLNKKGYNPVKHGLFLIFSF